MRVYSRIYTSKKVMVTTSWLFTTPRKAKLFLLKLSSFQVRTQLSPKLEMFLFQ